MTLLISIHGNQFICSFRSRCSPCKACRSASRPELIRRSVSPSASDVRAPSTVSCMFDWTSLHRSSIHSIVEGMRRWYQTFASTSDGTEISSPSASSGDVTTMAATVSTTVTSASRIVGAANRTEWSMRPMSEVARLSRSPVPAASTVPSGNVNALPTSSSRVSASTRSPSTLDRNCASRFMAACTIRITTNAPASRSIRVAEVPAITESTSRPMICGPASPTTVARPNSAIITENSRRLFRAVALTHVQTSRPDANGNFFMPKPSSSVLRRQPLSIVDFG